MNRVEETLESFYEKDYVPAGNNDLFVDEAISHKGGYNDLYLSIKIPYEDAVEKLDKESFITESGLDKAWFFELNGDVFYYLNNEIEGTVIGMERNINGCEYCYSKDIGNKLLNFCKELSENLK